MNKLKLSIYTAVSLMVIMSIIIFTSNNTSNKDVVQTYADNKFNSIDSLNRLMDGNKKFIISESNTTPINSDIRKSLYTNGQKPYAIVLTCSDSRVVPEDIFYTGLGEIFVIRVAGNVVDETVMGSIEYGIDELKIPLIMVMGHQDCGAVSASKDANIGGSLETILSKIRPSYEKSKSLGGTEAEILEHAINFNVENSIKVIKNNEVVKKHLKDKSIEIVGSNYSLESGKVTLLNNK